MSPYKKKKAQCKGGDKIDQFTITGASNTDNLTDNSNDQLLNSNMKIRINLNLLSSY